MTADCTFGIKNKSAFFIAAPAEILLILMSGYCKTDQHACAKRSINYCDVLNYRNIKNMKAVSNHNTPPQWQDFTLTAEEAVCPGISHSKINMT